MIIRQKRTFTATALVLFTVFHITSTTPLLDPIIFDASCPKSACNRNSASDFHVGKVYQYDYQVDVISEMRSASPKQPSQMNLKARVNLNVLSSCEYILEVENVQMPGKTKDFDQGLTMHPVQFSMENGQVQLVCNHPREPEWATNIKKGIISSFQSSFLPANNVNITETDVVGTCLTEYAPVEVNPQFVSYRKTKHMETCQDNQKLFQFALNLPDMNLQKLPLVKSEHVCNLVTSPNGKLESSKCFEKHLFQPFSSSQSGAMTTVEQKIEFVKEDLSSNTNLLVKGRTSSLLYSHKSQDVEGSKDQADHVLYLLDSYKSTADDKKAALFSDLVHSMRHLTHGQLMTIFYAGIPNAETRQLALDAIPLLKTEAGITLMRDIMESGNLPSETLDMWFQTLPYYKNPTRGMLTIVSSFLRAPRSSALIGVSSLVSTFCSQHENCQDLPEIVTIISLYEEFLGPNCQPFDQVEEDRMILSLKGLRNIGFVKNAASKIETCYQDTTNSMFLRLAALDTIRKLSCQSSTFDYKRQLLATFGDTTLDSELRIGAYLAIMTCPSTGTVNYVKSILTHEPVNQVGSFVWTHLTNLQESQSLSEYKMALKDLVGNEFLQNKWKTDVRKFSRFFETSYYAQELQVGATVEGQLVFSQDSYMPRSAMVNLTANVFGEDLHLLEVGGRVEGFESLFEDLFGPEGYFREDSLHKLLQTLRPKRHVTQDAIMDFQSTYNNEFDPNPKGNMYLRSFGRDLYYSSFDGLPSLVNHFTDLWPMSLMRGVDYQRSTIFLDGKIVLPTVAGLPLSLLVNGTSTVSVTSDNEFDVANLISNGDAKINVKLYPTATVEVSASMTVDAHVTQTGLKSMTKMHTSTFWDGHVMMKNGNVLKAQVNLPRDTMEILDVSVDYFALRQDVFQPLQSDNEPIKYEGCTPQGFSEIMGVKFCGFSLYHDNPQDQLDIVFSGPFSLNLAMAKTDNFDQYTFEYSWQQEEPELSKITAVLDTPGSRINRRSNMHISYNPQAFDYVAVDMEIPVRQIDFNAVYQWTQAKKLAKARLGMDNTELVNMFYSWATLQGRSEAQAKITYQTLEIVNWNAGLLFSKAKIDFDSKLMSYYLAQPITARGNVINLNDRWDLSGEITSQFLNTHLTGIFQHTDTSFNVKGDLRYSLLGKSEQSLAIQCAYKVNSVGELEKHLFFAQVEPRNYPEWISTLNWEFQMSDNYMENEMKLRMGNNVYGMQQLFSSQASVDYQELLLTLAFELPQDLTYKLNFEHRYGTQQNTNRLQLKIPSWIDLDTYMNYVHERLSKKFSAGLSYDSVNLHTGLDLKRPQNDDSAIDGHAFLRWGPKEDRKSNANADFELRKVQNGPDGVNYAVTTLVAFSELSPIKAEGNLKLDQGLASIKVKCQQGSAKFDAKAHLKALANSAVFSASVETSAQEYSVQIRTRNDNVKSVHAELLLDRKYLLNAVARRGFRDLLFDLNFGDQKEQRVLLKAQLSSQRVNGEFQILGNQGKMELEQNQNSIKAHGLYNGEEILLNSQYRLASGDYLLQVGVESTIPAIRLVKLNLQHSLDTSILNSKAELLWNEKTHVLTLQGEKSAKIWIQIDTNSAYDILNDFHLRAEHSRQADNMENMAEVRYKTQQVKVQTKYDNGKTKEGLLIIETPWEFLNVLKTGFIFNFGKNLQLDSYMNWNEMNIATANVTGHILPSDVDLDFYVSKEGTGSATGGFTYLKSATKGLSSSAHLEYGDNSFKLEGQYKTTPIVAKLKWDITTAALISDAEFDLFTGYGAIDVKSVINLDNSRLASLAWNSWFESVAEHRFSSNLFLRPYEITLVANNDKGINTAYEVTTMKNQDLLFTMKMDGNWKNEDEARSGDFNAVIINHKQEKTSISLQHAQNASSYESFLRMQSKHQVVELKHETFYEKNRLATMISLKTPFDYMKDASLNSDFSFVNTLNELILKGQVGFKFNDKAASLDLHGKAITHDDVKQYDLLIDADGFLAEANLETQVKLHNEGIFFTSSAVANDGEPIMIQLAVMKVPDATLGSAVNLEVDLPSQPNLRFDGEWKMSNDEDWTKTGLKAQLWNVFNLTTQVEMKGILEELKANGEMSYKDTSVVLSTNFKRENEKANFDFTLNDDLKAKVAYEGNSVTGEAEWICHENKYKASLKGGLMSEKVQAEIELLKNMETIWKLHGLVENGSDNFELKGIWEIPADQGQFETLYQKTANAWNATYNRNGQIINFNGQMKCLKESCVLKSQLDSPNALKFKIDANVIIAKEKSISMTAVANNEHKVEVKGQLKEGSGALKSLVNLPTFGIKDVSSEALFKTDKSGGSFKWDTNSAQIIDFVWHKDPKGLTANLKTVFDSLQNLRLHKESQDFQDGQKMHFEVDLNSVRFLTLDTHFERQRQIMMVKLTSAMESLKFVELNFKLNGANDFHLAAAYNHYFDVRCLGNLDNGKSNYTVALTATPLGADYIASFSFDVIDQETKMARVLLQGNDLKTLLEGRVASNQAEMTLSSWLLETPKSIKADWNLATGYFHVVIKDAEDELLSSELVFQGIEDHDPYQGTANFTLNGVFLTNPVHAHAKFNVGNTGKNIELLVSASGHYITISTLYKISEDKFNGELLWKSSIPGYETATLNGRYNIAVEPTAEISLERNGKVDYIKTRLTFGNVIPTIKILTSFPGFEELLISGNYNKVQAGHHLCDIALSRNRETLLAFSVSLKTTDQWQDGEIILDLYTPIRNWETLNLELGWKQESDPYGVKIKLTKGGEEISLKGKLSFRHMVFSVTVITPFEGYETISLSGNMATNSLGNHINQMGISFKSNTVRRDLSFAYDFDAENRALVHIKTPLEGYKSIKVRTMRMADMGSRMDFGFETQGQKDMAFGLKYDFSQGLANGMLLVKVEAGPVNMESKLDYSNVDGDMSNGFDLAFYFKLDGNVMASVTINRVPGHTLAKVETPVTGFEYIELNLESDYEKFVFASLKKPQAEASARIEKVGEKDFDVTLKTPARGYEDLKAELRTQGTKSVLTIFRKGSKISTITVDADIDVPGKSGKLGMRWEATQSLWTEVNFSYQEGIAEARFQAPKKDWTVKVESRDDGTTTFNKIEINMDGKLWHYSSERVWTEGKIVGQSKRFSEISLFDIIEPCDEESRYEIRYPKDVDGLWKLFYESKSDGDIKILIDTELDIQVPDKLDLYLTLKMPEILPNEFRIKLKCETDLESKFNGALTVQDSQVNLEAKWTEKQALVQLTSNIAGFEKVAANLKWQGPVEKRKYALEVVLNKQKLVEATLAYSTTPTFRMKILIKSDDQSQSLEIVQTSQSAVKITAKGFVNIDFGGKYQISDDDHVFEWKMKGNAMVVGEFSYSMKVVGSIAPRKPGISVMFENMSNKYEINLKGELVSDLIFSAKITVSIPGLIKFNLPIDFDLESQQKVLNIKLEMNEEVHQLHATVDWSPANTVLGVQYEMFNGQKIIWSYERQGWNSLECVLDIFGQKISLVSKNDINLPKFDVSVNLKIADRLPISVFLKEAKLSLNSDSSDWNTVKLSGDLILDQRSFTFNYEHDSAAPKLFISLESNQSEKVYKIYYRPCPHSATKLMLEIAAGPAKLEVHHTYPLTHDVLELDASENLANTGLHVKINRPEMSGTIKVSQGSQSFELNTNAKIDGQNYGLKMEALGSGQKLFELNAETNYPLEYSIDVSQGQNSLEFSVKVESDYSRGKMNFGLNGSSKNVQVEVDLKNEAGEKSADVMVNYDGQKFELEAEAKEGKMELEVKTSLPQLSKLDFEVEYESTRQLSMTLELNDKSLEINYENTEQSFAFDVKILNDNYVKANFNKAQTQLSFDSQIFGKVMTVNAAVTSGNEISITATEPFFGLGDMSFTGSYQKKGHNFELKANGDVNAMNYKLDAVAVDEVGLGKLEISIQRGAEEWKVSTQIDEYDEGNSIQIRVGGTSMEDFNLDGSYYLSSTRFKGKIEAMLKQTSYKANVEAKFKFPNKMGIEAEVVFDNQKKIDLAAKVNMASDFSDMSSEAKVFIPALGMKEEIGLEVVYHWTSPEDFELKSGIHLPNFKSGAGIKFKLLTNGFDAGLSFEIDDRNFKLDFGGSLDEAQRKLQAYLNNLHLTASYGDESFNLKVEGEKKDGDMILELIPYANLYLEFSFDGNRLKLEMKADEDVHFRAVCELDRANGKLTGGLIVKSEAHGLHKSSQVLIEYGDKGKVEITVGNQHTMKLEWPQGGTRVARAAFMSPTYGNYEFLMDRYAKKGIIVLALGTQSIHKFSYELNDQNDKIDLVATVESPYLPAFFRLTMDPENEIYSARLTINNDHVISGSVGLNTNDLHCQFSIRSSYVPSIDAKISFKNSQYLLANSLVLSWNSHEHSIKWEIKKMQTFHLIISSPILPGQKWIFEGSLEPAHGNTYKIKGLLSLDEETWEVLGNVTLNGCTDFKGSLVYHGDHKANLDFEVQLNQNNAILQLEVISTHKAVPRIKAMMSMLQTNNNGNVANAVFILPGLPPLEAEMNLPRNQWLVNSLNITAFTLDHHLDMEANWNMQDVTKTVQIVFSGPGTEQLVIEAKNTENSVVIESKSSIDELDNLSLELAWARDISLEFGWVKATLSTGFNQDVDVEMEFKMHEEAKMLSFSLNTPWEGFQSYAASVGYENSSRKTAKAHLAWPKGETGFKMDYFFNSAQDFLLEVDVDLPIPELKVTKVKIGYSWLENQKEMIVGAEWNEYIVGTEFKLKSESASTLLAFLARYNSAVIDIDAFADCSLGKGDLNALIASPWGQFELPLSANWKEMDLDVAFIVNSIPRLTIQRTYSTRTLDIELRDIVTNMSIKIGYGADQDNWESSTYSLEIIWDTARPQETLELISLGWKKSDTVCSFDAQITWPSRDVDSISGKYQKNPGLWQLTSSIDHNSNRQWGFDSVSQFNYDEGVVVSSQKLSIALPSHEVSYDFQSRHADDAVHRSGALTWAKENEEKQGLSYVYDVQLLGPKASTSTFVLRRMARQVQTFSTRYQTTEDDKRAIMVDINHSHNQARCINVEAVFDPSNSDEKRTMLNAQLKYKFGLRPAQRKELSSVLDIANKQLEIEMISNEHVYSASGKLLMQESTTLQVELLKNQIKAMGILVTLDNEKPSFSADIEASARLVQLFGGLEDPNMIRFKVKSQSEEIASDDIDLAISLSPDGRVLKVDFDWRPDMAEEGRQAFSAFQRHVMIGDQLVFETKENALVLQNILSSTLNETADDIRSFLDVDHKTYLQMVDVLGQNLMSLKISQVEAIQGFLSSTGEIVSYMTSEATLCGQKIMLTVHPLVEMSSLVIHDGMTFIFDQFKAGLEVTADTISKIGQSMARVEVSDFNVGGYIKVTVHFVRNCLETWEGLLRGIREKLSWIPTQIGMEIDADIHQVVKEAAQYLKKFKSIEKALTFYWQYQSWFEEFHLSQHFEEVTRDFRSWLMDINEQFEELRDTLVHYWNTTVGYVHKMLIDYPLLNYGFSMGKKAIRVAKALAEQMSVEVKLRNWIKQFVGRADAVASTLMRIIDVVFNQSDLVSHQFESQPGHILYSQTLPFQWYSFVETPDIFKVVDLVNWSPSEEFDDVDLKGIQHDMLELISAVSQAFRKQTVIPPFSATALVAGDSHILTFDQTYYQFSGAQGCSYLLVSDFSHGKFSAVANFDQHMKRTSIDVISDDMTINIDTRTGQDPDLIKVTLNKRTTQLPIQFDHTYVYRQENTINVENSEGLKISCNTVHNICSFTISGWYFGKTGGLLGIYDNEPSNDWMTSERKIASNLEDFVSSWSVSDENHFCPVKIITQQIEPTPEEMDLCQAQFDVYDESSALMPCFSSIDPRPFKEMCIRDVQALKNQADKRQGICASSAAYIKQCKQAGVELWMPAQCVNCNMNQETMRHGESSRLEGLGLSSADVVFIVQQGQCLNDIQLSDLPMMISRSLASKGFTDNRFALVGFGGRDQLEQPHIFTSGSRIFNDVGRMSMAITNLRSDGGEQGDVFNALQFAARLKYRPGVVKNFLLLRCDTSQALTSRAYGDSMTMLMEQSITLHLITPMNLRFKGHKLSSKIYGFTKDAVITPSELSRDLRRQLKDPKDHLSTLAQESGGSVLDLERLASSKRLTAKKASTMFSLAFAQLSRPLDCQVCDCLSDADGQGIFMCHRCVLPSFKLLQNLESMLD